MVLALFLIVASINVFAADVKGNDCDGGVCPLPTDGGDCDGDTCPLPTAPDTDDDGACPGGVCPLPIND